MQGFTSSGVLLCGGGGALGRTQSSGTTTEIPAIVQPPSAGAQRHSGPEGLRGKLADCRGPNTPPSKGHARGGLADSAVVRTRARASA